MTQDTRLEQVREDMVDPEQRAERRQAFLRERYRRARLPRNLWGVTSSKIPDSLGYKAEIEKYLRYLWKFRARGQACKGLYLYGPAGSGKTSIAAGITRWALDHDISAYYLQYQMMFETKKDNPAWDPESGVDVGAWDRILDVKLLTVDDVLQGGADNSWGELNVVVLEQLVRERWAEGKPTMMTGNVALDRMEGLGRLANVLREQAFGLEVRGLDYRRALGEESIPDV